jgi:large subunit ribosomal protein L22
MGARKHISANNREEAKKTMYFAKLNNCPSSPRKMRLVAELIRGKNVELALHTLKHAPQHASAPLYKLLLSAIANWQQKNEGVRMEESNLFVKEIMVDGGRMVKRISPAPQGRAHRIRKRSNHVTLFVDSKVVANEVNEIKTK